MSALEASRRKGQKEAIAEALDPALFLPGILLPSKLFVNPSFIKRFKRLIKHNLRIPENKTFYTYEGSLTTPPLLESVIWTVFRDPVTFSREQVSQLPVVIPTLCVPFKVRLMRCLKTTREHEDENDMVNNYRLKQAVISSPCSPFHHVAAGSRAASGPGRSRCPPS